MTRFIVFTDNFRPTEYKHSNKSLHLQTTAEQHNISNASFHCMYWQLQTKRICALPHFIAFTDNYSPNQYAHWNISLYLQKTADKHNICNATLDCIYRQPQTNWIYALPHFIFRDNSRTNHICTATFHFIYRQLQNNSITNCHISLYLKTNRAKTNTRTATFHFIYRKTQNI